MQLHHVLRQTGGGRVEVYAGFFFVDLDRTEYLAYYDRGFRELRFGRAEKENRKWTLTPMAPQEAPAVFRLLQDLENHCLESERRGRGETYVLQKDENGELFFVRKASGNKLGRFAHGVNWRGIGSWAVTVGSALLIACCILTLQEKLKAPPETPEITISDRRAALPAAPDYIQTLRAACTDERWAAMTVEERAALLQQVCTWETTAVLGCSACTIQVGDLEPGTLGYYDKKNEAIAVSHDALEKGDWQTMLGVVIHECRHAWQRDMIELLYALEEENPDIIYTHPFDTYADFRETWLGYTSGLTDFETYYDQIIERDSRDWTEERLQTWYLPNLSAVPG